MRRKLFTAASVLSLALCLGTVALWVRSWWDDAPEIKRGDSRAISVEIRAIDGRGEVQINRNIGFGALGMSGGSELISKWKIGGVRYSKWVMRPLGGGIGAGTSSEVRAPLWYLFAIWLILPLTWGLTYLRARSSFAKVHPCPACGYNLTGNSSGVFPECGAAVAGKVGA